MKMMKRWLIALGAVVLVAYFGGFITGWIWPKHEQIGEFPQINSMTRLFVLAPHPDDEVLIAGGLIQRVLEAGGQVKVVYLTNGDNSVSTVLVVDKKVGLTPAEFLDLGRLRMAEAKRAMQILDVKDLGFLGFPDRRLEKVLRGKSVSASTKFDHVPYVEAMFPGQLYTGDNLIADIASTAAIFKPTLMITTHLRDTHPDHKAAYEVAEEVKKEIKGNWDFYTALVHYEDYPTKGDFLIPPKKLFGGYWVSLELTETERTRKRSAIGAYVSQDSNYFQKNLFDRLTAKNEIFERE